MKEEKIVQDLLAKDFHPKKVYFVACGGSLHARGQGYRRTDDYE